MVLERAMMGELPSMAAADIGTGMIRIAANFSGLRRQTEEAMAEMRAEMKAGFAGLNAGAPAAKAMNRELEGATRQAVLLNAALKALALGGLTIVGGAMAMGLKAALDFEDAFAGVQKAVKATAPQLEALKGQFLGLSQQIPLSATEIANMGAQAASLGIPIGQMTSFIKTVSDLSAATGMAASDTETALAQMGQTLGLATKDLSRFSSALVAMGQQGSSTVDQIVTISRRIAPIGKQLGLTASQILAVSTAAGNIGLMPGTAASALSRLMMRLTTLGTTTDQLREKASKAGMSVDGLLKVIAGGGKNLTALAKNLNEPTKDFTQLLTASRTLGTFSAALGMTVTQYQRLQATNPGGLLTRIFQSIQGMDTTQRTQFIQTLMGTSGSGGSAQGVSVSQLLLGMSNALNGPQGLTSSLHAANEAWAQNTKAAEEAGVQYRTLSSQFALLKNTIEDALIGLGNMELPVLGQVLDFAQNALPKALDAIANFWKDDLEEPLTNVWNAIVRLGTALGAILLDWGPTGQGSQVGVGFSALATSLQAAADATVSLLDLFTKIAENPIVQVIGKLVVLLTALRLGVAALRGVMGAVGGTAAGVARLAGLGGLMGTKPPAQQDPTVVANKEAADTQVAAADMQMAAAKAQIASASAAAGTAAATAAAISPGYAMQQRWAAEQAVQTKLLAAGSALPAGVNQIGAIQYGRPNGFYRNQYYPSRQANSPLWISKGDPLRSPFPWFSGSQGTNMVGPIDYSGTLGPTYPGDYTQLRQPLSASPAAMAARQAQMEASLAQQAQAAGTSMIRTTATGLGTSLRGALSSAKGMLSSGLGFVAKAFWPMFIADMVGNMIAQPIGDFIKANTQFKRLGNEWSKGWIEGLTGTLKTAIQGTDAFVGRPGTYKIGGQDVPTDMIQSLAGLTGSSDQAGKLLDAMDGATNVFDALAGAQKTAEYMKEQMAKVTSLSPADALELSGSMSLLDMDPTGMAHFIEDNIVNAVSSFMGGDQSQMQGALDTLKQKMQDRITQMLAAAQGATANAITEAAKAAGFDLPGYKLAGLSADQLAKLGNLFSSPVPGGVSPGTVGLLQKFGAAGILGKAPGLLKAGAGMSGGQALTANLAGVPADLANFAKWQTNQQAEYGPLYEQAQQWLAKYGGMVETGNDSIGGRRSALKQITGQTFGKDAKGLAALNAAWSQLWSQFGEVGSIVGADQRRQIADHVQAAITQAMKDGVSLTEISKRVDFTQLFDGIGDQQTQIAARISKAVSDALGEGMHAATPKAERAAIALWNAIMPADAISTKGSLKSQVAAFSKAIIALYADQITSAAQNPTMQNAIVAAINALLPKDQQITWHDLTTRTPKPHEGTTAGDPNAIPSIVAGNPRARVDPNEFNRPGSLAGNSTPTNPATAIPKADWESVGAVAANAIGTVLANATSDPGNGLNQAVQGIVKYIAAQITANLPAGTGLTPAPATATPGGHTPGTPSHGPVRGTGTGPFPTKASYYGENGSGGGASTAGADYGPQPGGAGAPPGMLAGGNIDLAHRPTVKNADGSYSTIRSISVGTDQGEVLIPTVIPDGKGGWMVASNGAAIAYYKRTGQMLGIFDNVKDANAYAAALHRAQAKRYGSGTTDAKASAAAATLARARGALGALSTAFNGPILRPPRPALAYGGGAAEMSAPAGWQVPPTGGPPGGSTPDDSPSMSGAQRPINVQTMHIHGTNDEQSVLDTLAFMDPGSSW